MKPEFRLDIRETPTGDLMIKELRDIDCSIPFEDSVSVTIVKRKTTTSEEVVKAFVHNHSVTDVINRFPIKYDGRYIIIHAIIPTKSTGNFARTFLYSDGKLVEAVGGKQVEVGFEIFDIDLEDTNIQVMKKEAFVLYNLWQCYLNYCKRQFEQECSQNSHCNDCNNEFTEYRNLVWIFLNTIQYLMKLGRPEKAQELLEAITGCNSFCSNEMFSKLYDCGCGK